MNKSEVFQNVGSKIKEKLVATPPGSWAKTGVGVLAVSVTLGWLAFPYILDKIVAMQITLAEGKDSRKLWTQLPAFDFNIYIFNVTNPAEVMRGVKPAVEEIGPYCYKEIKDKIDFIEDSSSDTISYSARSTWYENQGSERCGAPQLTGEEMLTVPNVPLLAILLIAEKDFPPALLAVVNQALPAIFSRVNDVFLRVSARQLLFGGIPINCSARALYPRAVCIALKQNSRALKRLGRNQYLFSFFGAKNNTPEEFRYTVKRGTENAQDIGKLVALDGMSELPFWRGECNKIQGTDATVFPPFRKKENGSLTAYASEVCRSLYGIFDGEVVYKGMTGFAYSIILEDSEANPRDSCFCTEIDRCLKKGALDAFKCQGAPVVATLPHFYLSSQFYQNGVTGLEPNKEKHGIVIVLEPISGSPLIVRKRLQFNIDLKPINYVMVTKNLKHTLVPILWVEEKLDLGDDLIGLLEASLFRPLRAVDVIKWLAVVTGVSLGVAAAVIKYRNTRRDKVYTLDGADMSTFGDNSHIKNEVTSKDINMNSISDPFYIDADKTDKRMEEDNFVLNEVIKSKVLSNEPTAIQSLEKKLISENQRMFRSAPCESLGNQRFTENLLSVSKVLPHKLSSNGLKNANNGETEILEMTSEEAKLQSIPHLKYINTSLELQASITSSVPSFSKFSPYEPSLPVSIMKRNSPIEIQETNTVAKLNIPNQFSNNDEDNSILPERERSIFISNEGSQLGSKTSVHVSNAKSSVQRNGSILINPPVYSRNDENFSQPTIKNNPTQEEIEAVEKDMYNLMEEIAQLIPKQPKYK